MNEIFKLEDRRPTEKDGRDTSHVLAWLPPDERRNPRAPYGWSRISWRWLSTPEAQERLQQSLLGDSARFTHWTHLPLDPAQ